MFDLYQGLPQFIVLAKDRVLPVVSSTGFPQKEVALPFVDSLGPRLGDPHSLRDGIGFPMPHPPLIGTDEGR